MYKRIKELLEAEVKYSSERAGRGSLFVKKGGTWQRNPIQHKLSVASHDARKRKDPKLAQINKDANTARMAKLKKS